MSGGPANGGKLHILTAGDEHGRDYHALDTGRQPKSENVLSVHSEWFLRKGPPENVCPDGGPELTAGSLKTWHARLGIQPAYIEPGSPWENGFNENFNRRLRHDLPDEEKFSTLREAWMMAGARRVPYGHARPHGAPGYGPARAAGDRPPWKLFRCAPQSSRRTRQQKLLGVNQMAVPEIGG